MLRWLLAWTLPQITVAGKAVDTFTATNSFKIELQVILTDITQMYNVLGLSLWETEACHRATNFHYYAAVSFLTAAPVLVRPVPRVLEHWGAWGGLVWENGARGRVNLFPPPSASLNWRPISVFPGFINFLFCIFYGIYNPHHNIVSYSSLTCLCMCLFSSPLFYNMIIITIKQLAEALTYTNATVQSGRVEMCLETEVLILKSLLQHLLRT